MSTSAPQKIIREIQPPSKEVLQLKLNDEDIDEEDFELAKHANHQRLSQSSYNVLDVLLLPDV